MEDKKLEKIIHDSYKYSKEYINKFRIEIENNDKKSGNDLITVLKSNKIPTDLKANQRDTLILNKIYDVFGSPSIKRVQDIINEPSKSKAKSLFKEYYKDFKIAENFINPDGGNNDMNDLIKSDTENTGLKITFKNKEGLSTLNELHKELGKWIKTINFFNRLYGK